MFDFFGQSSFGKLGNGLVNGALGQSPAGSLAEYINGIYGSDAAGQQSQFDPKTTSAALGQDQSATDLHQQLAPLIGNLLNTNNLESQQYGIPGNPNAELNGKSKLRGIIRAYTAGLLGGGPPTSQ